jgi:hypothetical protein
VNNISNNNNIKNNNNKYILVAITSNTTNQSRLFYAKELSAEIFEGKI